MERLFRLQFNRLTALLAVLLLWSAVYLPSLGRLEVQSNEPKRMQPAEHMLVSGDWITPELYGLKYYKKPPLINWMLAASYRVCGTIDEFASRLPSVLMALAAAVVMIFFPAWLPLASRFAAAVFYLTTYAVIESGRLAEIESTLMSLTAIAVCWWLHCQEADRRHPWRQWLITGVILGLGLLLKGPAILLYFYLPVLATCWYGRQWKSLFHPAHVLGLLIMLAMFFAWAVPNMQAAPVHNQVSSTWQSELLQQIDPAEINWGNWIKQMLIGVFGFLPCLFLLPLMKCRNAATTDRREALTATVCLASLIAGFILVNMMPGTRGRYSAPLAIFPALLAGLLLVRPGVLELVNRYRRIGGIVAAVVLAVCGLITVVMTAAYYTGLLESLLKSLKIIPPMPALPPSAVGILMLLALTAMGIFLIGRRSRQPVGSVGVALSIALLIAAVTMVYSVMIIPLVTMFDIKRPAAQPLNQAAVKPLPIIVFSDDRPFFFYLRRPVSFLRNPNQLAEVDSYVVARKGNEQELLPRLNAIKCKLTPLAETVYKKETFVIYRLTKQP